ncbi:esterase [Desulfonema ishimotonii]|uniref:Esterase n=1 Tax=Desulfonema ishimotonii TaxID=45657 RepID=A0A401FXY1_9BACT|nr:alpha/beta fold hydrolase [Desulfonema ishimotonii]GBC61825.1 esterase [Desulfonema ishimotonii]
MKRIFSILVILALLVAGTIAGTAYVVGNLLTSPAPGNAGLPPRDLKAEPVELVHPSGKRISGWLIRGSGKRGVVVLMHCLRADRRAMLNRARFLNSHGYSALLFDFQAHGESGGDRITFGYREAEDAHAAVAFARRQFPSQPVAVIGHSLGGAACLLGDSPVRADAMLLEAVYPDIQTATAHRLELYLGRLGKIFTWPLMALMPYVLGVSPDELRPVEKIGKVRYSSSAERTTGAQPSRKPGASFRRRRTPKRCGLCPMPGMRIFTGSSEKNMKNGFSVF